MESPRVCPQCHQPLPPDAPDGLCPACLLAAAAGPPPSASGAGLPGDIIDIGDPAEVAKKLPQFEILEILGRGGMGVVYKARQLPLDRIVALKILPPVDALSPDFVARFTREARALAKLNHPNIVSVFDFGETGGLYYIAMELVDGANLRELQRARRLTPTEALAIVPRICDALQYAHEEGLVHRDIKPENILIDKKGRVKIADFGLAKMLKREPLDLTLTLSGMALGTMRYMAPEQMEKPEAVDHRADIYSLGVVIYEMLTGEVPVGRFELPSHKAQIDARLDGIVLHALERDVERRYQQASEIKTDVENVTSRPRPEAAPAGPATANSANRPFALLVGASALIVMASVWPCAIVAHGFLESFNASEVAHSGVYLPSLSPDSPAARAGLQRGDTIVSIEKREAHLESNSKPDEIWSQIPPGSNVEIKFRRGDKNFTLHTTRPEDAVRGHLNVLWQMILGLLSAFFVMFLFTSHPFPQARKWRGILAATLGFGALLILLFSDQPALMNPVRLASGSAPYFPTSEWLASNQRAIAAVGALGLLILGIIEIRGLKLLTSAPSSTSPEMGSLSGQPTAPDSPGKPKFSRLAVLGAAWAPWFFIAFSLMFFARITLHQVAPGVPPPGPQWWQLLLLFAAMPLGVLSPFATTILGIVAITKIKRSRGAIYGLWLAAFDALFYPLLVLFGVVIFMSHVLIAEPAHLKFPAAVALDILLGLTACFFAGRWVWRMIATPSDSIPAANV